MHENELLFIWGDLNSDLLKPSHLKNGKLYIDTVLSGMQNHCNTFQNYAKLCYSYGSYCNIRGSKIINQVVKTKNLYFEIADHLPTYMAIKHPGLRKINRPNIRI